MFCYKSVCFIRVFEFNTYNKTSGYNQTILATYLIWDKNKLKLIYKKMWYLLKNSQPSCKKGVALSKMASMKKSCEIQVVAKN